MFSFLNWQRSEINSLNLLLYRRFEKKDGSFVVGTQNKPNKAGKFPFRGRTFQIGQIISILGDKNGGRSATFAPRNRKSSNRTITQQNCTLHLRIARQTLESHVKFPDRTLVHEKRGRNHKMHRRLKKRVCRLCF